MRHGQTVWNVQKRLQGRRDSPLTALGVSQAQAFGARLAQIIEKPSAVQAVSSPLGRAWQTAVLAVSGMGADPSLIVLDDRLVEHAFGQWEGLVW
ncbi:MAG: histidine phosphatase family protein, partial [Rhodospirillales bacterium]